MMDKRTLITDDWIPANFCKLPRPIESINMDEVLLIHAKTGQRYVALGDGTIWRMRKIKSAFKFE